MVTIPLVSVITPTWRRHGYLLRRAVPSVRAQAYPAVEHVIVSDGPDEDLWFKLRALDPRPAYGQLAEHREEKHWGAAVRREALEMATGEFIAYLDDDDAFRPDHLALHADALRANPGAGFSVSQMEIHNTWGSQTEILGKEEHPLQLGLAGTPMIVHRRELLDVATWGEDHITEDWNLISAWLDAGISYTRIYKVTVDVWPGRYRYGED